MDKNKIFKTVFLCFFLAFIVSYIIEKTGYYEYNLQNKIIMTNESIAQFEKDLAEGKDVTKEDYVVITEKDYTSALTNTTTKVSIKVNKILKKGIEGMFKVVGTVFEE